MADPFDTLEIEARFDLDLGALSERHRELSLALHPDRFAGRPAVERREALSRAIEVNAAKRALSDPVRRAEALLARLGMPVGEGQEPAAAAELLMAMMERREALREAALGKDRAAIGRLSAEAKAEEREVMERLGQLFVALLAREEGQQEEVQDELLRSLGALRYYRRFFDEAGSLVDELD